MLPLAFTAFLAFGYVLVVVGASQVGMAADLGLDLERFGLLGATLALGVGAGVLCTGPLVDRLARRPILVAACLGCAASLATVSPGMTLARALLHVLALGASAGCIDALLNAVVVERFRERAARPLAVLHGAATLGAVLSPPLIGWVAAVGDHWTVAFQSGAAVFAGVAGWAAFVALPGPASRPAPESSASEPQAPRPWSWLASLAGLGVVGFAYVGVENGVTVFAVPYSRESWGLAESVGREAISAFWLGLLGARIGLALRRGPTGPGALAVMGAAGAAVIGLGVATGWPGVRLWALAVGLCLGGVFPLMVALAGLRAPHAVGTATAVVIGTASLGGFVVPWLAGAIGDRVGAAGAVASLAGASLAIAAGGWALQRRERRPGPRPSPTFAGVE
ncbi:MAG: MFS transporter [Myxococcota bacterium]